VGSVRQGIEEQSENGFPIQNLGQIPSLLNHGLSVPPYRLNTNPQESQILTCKTFVRVWTVNVVYNRAESHLTPRS